MAINGDFKMAAAHHFVFYEFEILSADTVYGSVYAIVTNFVAICQTTVEHGLLIFQDGCHHGIVTTDPNNMSFITGSL